MNGMDSFDPGLAAASLLAGGALGALFFGGLWWTLRRLSARRRRHPYGWLAASFIARTAAVLAGFVLLLRIGGWWTPVVALVGFLAARQVLVRSLAAAPDLDPRSPERSERRA